MIRFDVIKINNIRLCKFLPSILMWSSVFTGWRNCYSLVNPSFCFKLEYNCSNIKLWLSFGFFSNHQRKNHLACIWDYPESGMYTFYFCVNVTLFKLLILKKINREAIFSLSIRPFNYNQSKCVSHLCHNKVDLCHFQRHFNNNRLLRIHVLVTRKKSR